MSDTPRQRLATILLVQAGELKDDEDVLTWLHARRAKGDSWYKLADDLANATNGEMRLSHQAIANWLDAIPAGPKAAS